MQIRAWLLAVVIGCGGGNKQAASPEPMSNQAQPSSEPPSNHEAAETDAQRDAREAAEAHARVEALSVELDAMEQKVSIAVDAVIAAQNDGDRAAAAERLKLLQREMAELKQRLADASSEAARHRRNRGDKINKECLDNPLAKGCD